MHTFVSRRRQQGLNHILVFGILVHGMNVIFPLIYNWSL